MLLLVAIAQLAIAQLLFWSGWAQAQPVMGSVDTTHVVAKPLTLQEIIARCMQGEKTKLAGHHDMTYTMTERAIVRWKDKKEIHELVHRVYGDSTGFSRIVEVAERESQFELRDGKWTPASKDDALEFRAKVTAGEYSDFANLPFFLEDAHEYDFELLDRTLEVDHVIFKIGFKPKSPFKALPSGVVYVDTNRYRIIHEEFRFDTNPFPLLVKDVKRVSRQWQELPGGEWVFTKILAEVEMRTGLLRFMPHSVSVAVLRDGFSFDTGYDVAMFGER